MSAITKREFDELAQHGGNSLAWATNVEIWLEGKQLWSPIDLGGKGAPAATSAENAQALHFLRRHLCATLKIEYMAEQSALALWTALKRRFERLKYSTQPQAEAEWARLRFADFRSIVTDSQKIEKTLSTFHPDAGQSSRSYRQANYKEYSELIDILQVAEAHDEVLKKNFVVQPLGTSARPEVQANDFKICKPLKKKKGKKARKNKKETKVPKGPQASVTDTTTPMDVEPSGNPPSGLDLGDDAALFTMYDVTANDIALEVNGLMEEST
ncbi:uncharacterized protein LOC104581403 [Brachypodium distachyon]|uniref:uncharacterized protein LOC104581403 n=1 Tax=Brachypodium distachyon TaxID=15368 RepID=UPI00052FE907|nr:uncharacterized protein LOC104581403 [Brachypodium distachyon]|eukprot:XP_010227205.1 uncharacterized protein LOC104581403 [Brachypodium distachyon]